MSKTEPSSIPRLGQSSWERDAVRFFQPLETKNCSVLFPPSLHVLVRPISAQTTPSQKGNTAIARGRTSHDRTSTLGT